MSAAERLLDSLRDLLYAWTNRLVRRSSRVPCIDMHALVERHEARRGSLAHSDPGCVRERVTMNDHAVSRIFDRRQSESEWPE